MLRLLSLLLTVLALVAAACGGDDPEAGARPPAAVAETAVTEVEQGTAALLDVRTREEYQEGYPAGSEHVPLADLQQGDRPSVPKDARLYVLCRTGRRAAIAVDLLRSEGWKDVVNIGGLDDWRRAGGTVVRR